MCAAPTRLLRNQDLTLVQKQTPVGVKHLRLRPGHYSSKAAPLATTVLFGFFR